MNSYRRIPWSTGFISVLLGWSVCPVYADLSVSDTQLLPVLSQVDTTSSGALGDTVCLDGEDCRQLSAVDTTVDVETDTTGEIDAATTGVTQQDVAKALSNQVEIAERQGMSLANQRRIQDKASKNQQVLSKNQYAMLRSQLDTARSTQNNQALLKKKQSHRSSTACSVSTCSRRPWSRRGRAHNK